VGRTEQGGVPDCACVRACTGGTQPHLPAHSPFCRVFAHLSLLLARLAHDYRCHSPCSLASPPATSPLPPPSSPTTSPSPPTSSLVYIPISMTIDTLPLPPSRSLRHHLAHYHYHARPAPPPLLCVDRRRRGRDRAGGRACRREGVRACVNTVVPCMRAWRRSYSCVSMFV